MPTWAEVGAGGLGLPDPPGELASQLRVVGPQRWGTREHTGSLRALGYFSEEFITGKYRDEYVLAETTEVGQHTPIVVYLLAYGNLGLFIEADARLVGGPNGGPRTLSVAAELQDLYIRATAEDRVEPCRFIVVHSDFGVQRWEFHSTPPQGGLEPISLVLRWMAHLSDLGR